MASELLIDSALVQRLRLAAGLTVEQLAVRAGLAGSRVRQIVSSDQNARLSTVAQFADALGTNDPRKLLVVRGGQTDSSES